MSTPVNIYSPLKTNTGSVDGENAGEEMRVAHYGPRVRSEPKDIIRPDMSEWRASSLDDDQLNRNRFSMRWADKIARRLRRPIELHQALFDGDDGYNSGGEGNEENNERDRQRDQEENIFVMDEDYDFEPQAVEVAPPPPPPVAPVAPAPENDDDNDPYFPEHMFISPVVLTRPLKRSTPYSVEEYQELTAHGRCRRSGNRAVDPRDLRSLYQRVRTYVEKVKAAERCVPDVPVGSPPPVAKTRLVLEKALEIVPEESDLKLDEKKENEAEEEPYSCLYFRKRFAEKQRRSKLGILSNNLFEIDPIKPVARTFNPRPSSPVDKSPEPLNQFLFDEQELN